MDRFQWVVLHIVEHLPFFEAYSESNCFVGDTEYIKYSVGLGFGKTDDLVKYPLEFVVDILVG